MRLLTAFFPALSHEVVTKAREEFTDLSWAIYLFTVNTACLFIGGLLLWHAAGPEVAIAAGCLAFYTKDKRA